MSHGDRLVAVPSGSTRVPFGLLVTGAGLIIANWLVLGLIVRVWNPSTVYVALALLVLLSAFGIGGVSLGVQTRRVIGWFFGLAALAMVLSDFRYDRSPDDALGVIAHIIFYAGAVLMFVGAGQLSD